MENFKCIREFSPRYWVSDLGKVFDCEEKRFLHQPLTAGSKYYGVWINKKLYYTHRLIATAFIDNPHNKKYVDHIDGNRLNNSLDNLRWVTSSENQHNRRTAKGYHWDEEKQKWKAGIRVNNKKIHLGYFDTEEEARQAYLDAKKIYHPSSPIR